MYVRVERPSSLDARLARCGYGHSRFVAMKFTRAAFPLSWMWSSPFVRWQGSLADVSSIDLAAMVTKDALASRLIDPASIGQLVLGQTIPQRNSFYAAPWLASRLNMPAVSGPLVAQACATSVACVASAASQAEAGVTDAALIVTTDRTSNGPLLVYPRSQGMGGSPTTENWVLDSFAADPNTGQAMVATAENVAREGGISRGALDDLTMLRWQQYQGALAADRAFQRRYMQPVVLARGKGRQSVLDADEGIHPYDAGALAALRPVQDGGMVTFGSQTHPADGCAGAVLMTPEQARSRDSIIVRVLSATFARAGTAQMPKAATIAAQAAVAEAGITFDQVACVVTHNPFAVNDAWFSQQTGYPLERMNPFGCSLIYGHPQGPTGLRGIIELAHALALKGGGLGVFTGCAAGDTGAALVISVE